MELVRFDCFRIAKDRQKLADKMIALCYGDTAGDRGRVVGYGAWALSD